MTWLSNLISFDKFTTPTRRDPAKFGGCRHRKFRDILFFICNAISLDYKIKGLCDFLSPFVQLGGCGHCECGYILLLNCMRLHVLTILKDNVTLVVSSLLEATIFLKLGGYGFCRFWDILLWLVTRIHVTMWSKD